jgi:hypothetical protein
MCGAIERHRKHLGGVQRVAPGQLLYLRLAREAVRQHER